MAQQANKSQIINELKRKSKGGWSERSKNVDPRPRGGGGLPPGLKNCVGCCKSYKLDKASNGNPFFMLTMIVKDPEELEGRRASVSWFMADSEYQTYEECEAALANDIALMCPDTEMPDDFDGILDVFKDLCERGVHLLFNTGRERKGGKAPNLFIQGLAEGWQDQPEEDAGEDTEQRGQRRAPAQQSAPARNGQLAPHQEASPEDEQPAEDDANQEIDQAANSPDDGSQEEGGYIPQKGDRYKYKAPGKRSAIACEVVSCNAAKETVNLKACKAAPGKKPEEFKNVPFGELEVDE